MVKIIDSALEKTIYLEKKDFVQSSETSMKGPGNDQSK